MNRIILLLDMDAFFAAIEELHNPQFRGRPVVVGADPREGKGRGVVSTCNYEARKYGIHSALPISQAWRLCPEAVFLPVNGRLYAETSARIMNIVRAQVPLVEQVSLDEAYADISFLETYKKAKVFAENLQKEIAEKERLPASFGIGPNKMVAKIACEKAKPQGILAVEPGKVQGFLDPLPIQKIPGVGPRTEALLRRFSLAKPSFQKLGLAKEQQKLSVKDVKEIPKEALRALLGKYGETLYWQVKAVDNSPVVPEHDVKSIGREHTFEKDTRDGEEIFSVFRELQQGVWEEVKEENLAFKTITVVCRFQGFETHTKSTTLTEGSQDMEVLSKESARLLLRFLVENPKQVRLIGLRLRIAPAAH